MKKTAQYPHKQYSYNHRYKTKHFFDLLKYTKNWNHVTYKQTQLSIMTAAIMKPIFKKRLAKPFFDLFVIINFIHGVHMYLDPDF